MEPSTPYVRSMRQTAAAMERHQKIPRGSQRKRVVILFAYAQTAVMPHTTTGRHAMTARVSRPNASHFAAKIAMMPSPVRSAPNAPMIIMPHDRLPSPSSARSSLRCFSSSSILRSIASTFLLTSSFISISFL